MEKKSEFYSYLCHQFSLQRSTAPVKNIHNDWYTVMTTKLALIANTVFRLSAGKRCRGFAERDTKETRSWFSPWVRPTQTPQLRNTHFPPETQAVKAVTAQGTEAAMDVPSGWKPVELRCLHLAAANSHPRLQASAKSIRLVALV